VITDLSVSPTATTTYYVTVQGEGVCENIPGEAVAVTVVVNPTATSADIVTEGGEICVGESFELIAGTNTVSNPVFTWYRDLGLTTPLTNLTVNPTVTTTYYVTVQGDNICENRPREAAAVTVVVNPPATAEDINVEDTEICIGDSFELTASSTSITDPVFTWYADAGLTQVITDLNVSPTVTTAYYVTVQGEGICENIPGEAAAVTVTVNPTATVADINVEDTEICVGESYVLNATSAIPGALFTWYADAGLTQEITDLNVSPAVTTTYYVTVQGEGICENIPGEAAAVTVTVNPSATATDIIVEDAEICIGDSVELVAGSTSITDPVFTWYADAGLTEPITNLNVSPTATTTYYVTVQGEGICENISGEAAAVTVTVNPTATAEDIDAVGGEICIGDSFDLTASSTSVTNPVFTWYADADLTQEITELNVSPTVTTTYYVTVQGEGICENIPGEAATVTVTANPSATAADIIVEDAEICVGESYDLTANSTSVTNPVFTWYADANLTEQITDLNVSPAVTTTYYVTVRGTGICENLPSTAVAVTVAVNSVASPTTNSPEQSFCLADGATIADLQINETNVVWYDAANGGNRLMSETPLEPGRIYYAALVDANSGCESAERLAVKVTECADLTVTKAAASTSALVGEMFDYTITLTNNGVAAAANVTVTDVLPIELVLVETSHGGELEGNTLTWLITELEAGESVSIKLTVMAVTESAGIINKVHVKGDNTQPDEDETDPLPIGNNDIDLSLSKQVSAPMVEVGKEFTYQLRVTNNSDNMTYNIVATDVFPEEVAYLGSVSNEGSTYTYDADVHTLTWNIPALAPNTTDVLQIKVRADQNGEITNTAFVQASDQTDTSEADNTATVTHSQVKIVIPNAFSPNGDHINDTWEIVGLTELYPDNEVIIVNRWGGEVYRSKNYQNDWNGGSLNEGTYYYQLTIKDSSGRESQFTGYVTILR
jgi:gliding motility-associated-like protein/uncharacterized repeat protein (TIGR01451 family)